MNRTLIIIGVTLVVVGLLWKPLSSLPFFRLPGDIVSAGPGFKAYVPFVTMIVVSAVVSLLLWLFRGERGRRGGEVRAGRSNERV